MRQASVTDKIANRVAGFGALLALFGIVSSVITFVGYELRILMWIDLWGPLVAWGIRLALIVGGVGIFFFAKIFDKTDTPEVHAEAAAERRQAWDAMKHHPRVQQFLADAAQTVRIAWEPSADPEAYVVRQVIWQDAQYRYADPSTNQNYTADHPQVTNVAFYLERANAPQRIVCGQDFTTRQIFQQEAHPGTWSIFVG